MNKPKPNEAETRGGSCAPAPCSAIPPTCEACPHRDFDEAPDGENMWSWCKHPSIANADPYFGRMALDSKHGTNPPPPECPLGKSPNDKVSDPATKRMNTTETPPPGSLERMVRRRG